LLDWVGWLGRPDVENTQLVTGAIKVVENTQLTNLFMLAITRSTHGKPEPEHRRSPTYQITCSTSAPILTETNPTARVNLNLQGALMTSKKATEPHGGLETCRRCHPNVLEIQACNDNANWSSQN
jgi:hypothetical protein